MRKQLLFIISIIFYLPTIFAQGVGVNKDPFQKDIGKMPYEMKGRVEERVAY